MITTKSVLVGLVLAAGLFATGCHEDMYEQKKYVSLSESDFYKDAQSARPPVEGTVVHRDHSLDGTFSTGMMNGQPVNEFPFRVTKAVIRRGQERFDIFCSPCHGQTGEGNGLVVQRGFPQPPSYFSDSVRALPVGRYVDVITNGFGKMYPYGDRVPPSDRWAIAAYIRVLQASRSVHVADLTTAERDKLK